MLAGMSALTVAPGAGASTVSNQRPFGTELILHFVHSDDVVAVAYGNDSRRITVRVGLHLRLRKIVPLEIRAILPHCGETTQTEQQCTEESEDFESKGICFLHLI